MICLWYTSKSYRSALDYLKVSFLYCGPLVVSFWNYKLAELEFYNGTRLLLLHFQKRLFCVTLFSFYSVHSYFPLHFIISESKDRMEFPTKLQDYRTRQFFRYFFASQLTLFEDLSGKWSFQTKRSAACSHISDCVSTYLCVYFCCRFLFQLGEKCRAPLVCSNAQYFLLMT